MDFFNHRYYKLNRDFLLLIGQWPYQNPKEQLWRRTIVTFFIGTFELAHIAAMFTTNFTLDFIAEFVPYAILNTLVCIRYWTTWITIEETREMLERIKENWEILKDKTEITIAETINEEVFVYSSLGVYVLASLSPIFIDLFVLRNESTSGGQIPLEYFVDQDKYFVVILLHIYTSIGVGVTIMLATDITFILFIQQGCGIFRLASYQMEHASDEINKLLWYQGKYTPQYKQIIRGIQHHQRAILFAAKINNFYGWSQLAAVILTMISISVSLFCSVIYIGRWKEMALSMGMALTQLAYLSMDGYLGQKLMDHSTDIFENAYNMRWYEVPINVRKLVLIVMQRSLTPSIIITANLCALHFESYGDVVKTSVAYFTTLTSFR